MGKRFLIDSNAIIEFIARLLPEKAQSFIKNTINEEFNISFINKIEVLAHTSADTELQEFIDFAIVHYINDDIIKQAINIRKEYKIKLPDIIVASTALVNGLTLITRNTKDFKNIKGLDLINPWDI